MATSIAEQIAVKVRSRLALIDADDGYETTTSGAVRSARIGTFQPKDYRIVVAQGSIRKNDELSHPGNPPAQAWEMPFSIHGILRPSETDLTAQDTLKNQFWGDCVKALCDDADWHTWDGLSINSVIGSIVDYQSQDGSDSGFAVELLVTFRTDETNPYNVRA